MSFPSMHPDQILHFSQYNSIVSLPMFLFHQVPCIICLTTLASMIPTLLTRSGDFIPVPLFPVSDHIEWRPIPFVPQL